MCTCLSNEYGSTVSVVEHLSAAFYCLGITNVIVEMHDCCEIPIMDGSALPFVEKIFSVGLKEQSAERKKLKILKMLKIGDEKRWASLSPADSFVLNVTCDYSLKNLMTEAFSFDMSKDSFVTDLSMARTFGFLSDVDYLKKNKLALGASLDNSVVFDEQGCAMNEAGLRCPNEPIRHKVLDAIGDLSLAQCEIIGKYDSFCPGHGINNLLLRELFSSDSNFEIIS
jgi:UDP-3-O-[3-hydroxymyristoyl] N-acetylglucosamine deacetylase